MDKKQRARLILEAREDRERFKAWGGEKLFDRFMLYKDRLSQPYNDMTFWASTRNPHQPEELAELIKELEDAAEEKAGVKQSQKDGSRKVQEDDKWLVLEITTFEASAKYGAGTKWCITGKNMAGEDSYGNQYWDDYTEGGATFYFILSKLNSDKFALMLSDDGYRFWDKGDHEVSHIPDGPTIDELDIDTSVDNEAFDNGEEEENMEDAEPPLPPPYTAEPVSMEQAMLMGFFAPNIEAAIRQYKPDATLVRAVLEVPRGSINLIKVGEKFQMFFWDGRGGGPFLMGQPGNFSLLNFDEEQAAVDYITSHLNGVQVRHSDDPEEAPEEARGELGEAYYFTLEDEEILEGNVSGIPGDDAPAPIDTRGLNESYLPLRYLR